MEADIFEAAWSLWNLESSLTEALLMVAVQSLRNENIQRFNHLRVPTDFDPEFKPSKQDPLAMNSTRTENVNVGWMFYRMMEKERTLHLQCAPRGCPKYPNQLPPRVHDSLQLGFSRKKSVDNFGAFLARNKSDNEGHVDGNKHN